MKSRPGSLTQLFLIGILVIGLPLLAGSMWMFIQLKQLSEESQTLVVRSLEIGRESEKLGTHINDMERNARQYLIVGETELYELYEQRYQQLNVTLALLEALTNEPDVSVLLGEIRKISIDLFEQMQMRAKQPGTPIETQKFDELVERSEELRFYAKETIWSQLDTVVELASRGRYALYWGWGLSLSLMLMLLLFFTWFIARPIQQLDFHIRRLGRGDFDTPVSIETSSDLMVLSERLDWLRKRMIEIENVKEQFFREMSHQLKTPLASICEGTELLLDKDISRSESTAQEVIKILHLNSLDLQHMLENMLNFSGWRMEAQNLHKETFAVSPLLKSIKARYGVALISRQLHFHILCVEDLTIYADRTKFRVVLDNLVSNAIKFSFSGGQISVSVTKGKNEVVLDVCDGGPGILPEERSRVFELFYLAPQLNNVSFRGTGVGLTLVRAYVEAHGGNVQVVEEKEAGAHFRAVFPQI